MAIKDLNIRRDKILGMIIDTYINNATPIASRAISRKLRMSLSPATIRNVMSDLEEDGLITHPHTSAGRIPTEKGYRYYIDKLMSAVLLTEEEKRRVDREFKSRVNEINDILDKATHVLSSVTNQAGIVLFPFLQKSEFSHVELIRLNGSKILVVLMAKTGFTKDFVIEPNDEIEDGELTRIANFINNNIGKGSLNSIRKEIMQKLLAERDSFYYILEKAKAIIDTIIDILKQNRIYLDGRAHMADQPEFNDIHKLKNLFRKLEDKDFMFSLLKRSLDADGVHVYIGSELGYDGMEDCSLITCNYCIGDASCGTVGVLGPTRMEYPKLISMVNYVAARISRHLSGGE
ncbi:MAG: heat-inducible transcription repressor HrcA [Candidatus Omnitrophica bacterium]|nr:heat-inducible transcription repressor HrcA [Candidatus Omnitrophota bacterium]